MTSRTVGKVVLACLTCEGALGSGGIVKRSPVVSSADDPVQPAAATSIVEQQQPTTSGSEEPTEGDKLSMEECRKRSPYDYQLAGFLCGRRYMAAKKKYEKVAKFDFFTPAEKFLKTGVKQSVNKKSWQGVCKNVNKKAWQFFSVTISALAQLSHTRIFAVDEDKVDKNIWRVSPEDDEKFLQNLLIAECEADIKRAATDYYNAAITSASFAQADPTMMRKTQDTVKRYIVDDNKTGRQLIEVLSQFLYKLTDPSPREPVQEVVEPVQEVGSIPQDLSNILDDHNTGRSYDKIHAWMNREPYVASRRRRQSNAAKPLNRSVYDRALHDISDQFTTEQGQISAEQWAEDQQWWMANQYQLARAMTEVYPALAQQPFHEDDGLFLFTSDDARNTSDDAVDSRSSPEVGERSTTPEAETVRFREIDANDRISNMPMPSFLSRHRDPIMPPPGLQESTEVPLNIRRVWEN